MGPWDWFMSGAFGLTAVGAMTAQYIGARRERQRRRPYDHARDGI